MVGIGHPKIVPLLKRSAAFFSGLTTQTDSIPHCPNHALRALTLRRVLIIGASVPDEQFMAYRLRIWRRGFSGARAELRNVAGP